MSCSNPLIALRTVNENGVIAPKIIGSVHSNSEIEFFRKQFGDSLIFLPCGKCPNCLKDYSRLWVARLLAESLYHNESYFITLTYSSNPPDKPSKVHLRDFIKKVRNQFGKGIKFFACGEVGSNTHRSHYHLILFGLHLSDLEVVSKRGLNFVYNSRIISDLWNKGFISIGSVDFSSCSYVANYCQKKHLSKNDGEFLIMSRGLGKQYLIDNIDHILDSDYLYLDGLKLKIPRYFLDLYAKSCLSVDKLLDYKLRKLKNACRFRFNSNVSTTENNARILTHNRSIEDTLRKEVNKREF